MKRKKRSVARGLYRHFDKLVIREGARFPDRCVICNKECDGEPLTFTFRRERAHYIEVAAVQAVAHMTEDLLKGARYTGPVEAAIPMCSWHRNRRLLLIGVGLGITVLAAAFLLIRYAIGGANEFDVFRISIYSVIAIVAALIGIAIALAGLLDPTKLWFKPTKYFGRFVWLAGAGREFLRTLPELEEYHYKPDSDNPHLSADELIRRGGLEEDD